MTHEKPDNDKEWSPWNDVPHCPWPEPPSGPLVRFDWACWRLQMTRRQVAERIQAGNWPEVPPTCLPPMTDEQLRWRPGHREGIQRAFVEAVAAALGIEAPNA
jgi:hypothetical protein